MTVPAAGASTLAEQLSAIGKGPMLSRISNTLLVPFPVVRLRQASVVWINHRVFSAMGIDTQQADTRRGVVNWLLETFAFVADRRELTAQYVDRQCRTILHADRYGSNAGLGPHGGSGRAAAVGQFHIKGIGRTPLVGCGGDRQHSHGWLSLNVALREAIYSEVAALEVPHGAVPTLAVLATGTRFEASGTPTRELHGAILVRPAMLRVAHLQRAAGFIDPLDGHENSQVDDANRVRDVVRHISRTQGASGLEELVARVARQIAFGQVHRFYSGGYFSSNITLQGELLDFGNAHVFPDWANARVLDADRGFGYEMLSLVASVHSLAFHLHKFAGPGAFEMQQALTHARAEYARVFAKECKRVLGMSNNDHSPHVLELVRRMTRLFHQQQATTVHYSAGERSPLPWFVTARADTPDATHSMEGDLQELLALAERFATQTVSAVHASHRRTTAQRYLLPRTVLFRDNIQQTIDRILATNTLSSATLGSLSAYVDNTVSGGRRHWPVLPDHLTVLSSATHAGDSALTCAHATTGEPYWWLEGRVIGGVATFFEQRFPTADIIAAGGQATGQTWQLQAHRQNNQLATLHDFSLNIPQAVVHYALPETRF